MMSDMPTGPTLVGQRDLFRSKLGFVLAATGSAVGLGSVWKFPYIVGQNGGGAYLLVYMAAVFLIGIPVMIAEFVIGRHSGRNALEAYSHYSKKYKAVGMTSVIVPSVILSYYCVIGGWAIMYLYLTVTGQLTGLAPDQYANVFGASVADMGLAGLFFLIFMLLTIITVMKGVSGGIEKACTALMPALFIVMIGLAIVGCMQPGGLEGVKWYLQPDFSKITGSTFIYAVGQVFFTLSLGMGIMVTYASYLSKDDNIPRAATVTTIADTVVSLLAGFAIFPAVFAFGLEPAAGPGLMFITLPNVFNQLPAGTLIGAAYYILLLFAALPSAISLMEVSVSYIIDTYHMSRVKATWVCGTVITIIGIPTLLAYGPWSEIKLFGFNFFDLYDYIASYIFLPLIGLATVLILTFSWSKEAVIMEVTNQGKLQFGLKNMWYYIVKWIIPVMLVLLSLQSLGILNL